MKELKLKIEKEIREIEELTDFYLARHDEDPLGTCIDRFMAMLVVALVSIIVFSVCAVFFALMGEPLIVLGVLGIGLALYILTWIFATAGEKVNKAKEAEYDRYISNLLKDEKRDRDAQHEQEKA